MFYFPLRQLVGSLLCGLHSPKPSSTLPSTCTPHQVLCPHRVVCTRSTLYSHRGRPAQTSDDPKRLAAGTEAVTCQRTIIIHIQSAVVVVQAKVRAESPTKEERFGRNGEMAFLFLISHYLLKLLMMLMLMIILGFWAFGLFFAVRPNVV